MAEFSHVDKNGNAVMVNVGNKDITSRTALAEGKIFMSKECFDMVNQGKHKKGDVLTVAQIAGIMGAKHTSDLIPMCHNIALNNAKVTFEALDNGFLCKAEVKCDAKTGVEMEALTAASVALLTVYDMCKAVDKRMVIKDIHLVEKHGGKSGDFKF